MSTSRVYFWALEVKSREKLGLLKSFSYQRQHVGPGRAVSQEIGVLTFIFYVGVWNSASANWPHSHSECHQQEDITGSEDRATFQCSAKMGRPEQIWRFGNSGSTGVGIGHNLTMGYTGYSGWWHSEAQVKAVNYNLFFPIVTYQNISEKWRIRAECIQHTKERNEVRNGMNQIEKKAKQMTGSKRGSHSGLQAWN